MSSSKKNVLVVGQVPPPWHGQAIAINELLESKFDRVDLHFVKMAFSDEINEVGRFQWRKLLHLSQLISRIWLTRFQKNCSTLYYPPGGTGIVAVARDAAVLLSCRMLFRRVIFHAHAGGFSEVAKATPMPIRIFAELAYRKPDLLIQLTEKSPPDGSLTKAKRIICVPNGLPDDGGRYIRRLRNSANPGKIGLLFVGAVSSGKGVMVLLQACAQLKADGHEFLLRVVGRFDSSEFEGECKSFINHHRLNDDVEFTGVLIGEEKWEIFCRSDIFCFPSSYKAENQPLAILEAMQFALPVIASDWRGIPTMVEDGETGFIVPINDPAALADRIVCLIEHPELRTKMGERSREVFLEGYTDAVWRPAMESALSSI